MINNTIVNTRPTSKQNETKKIFEKAGYNVINFPCIEIQNITNQKHTLTQLSSIKEQETIIFTSQYSASYAFKLCPNWIIPKSSIVIAVGIKTSLVLEQNYSGNIWRAEPQNSDGVIDLLKGLNNPQSISLITAVNGRMKIQNYAKENNIKLSQINVYQRTVPIMQKKTIANLESQNNLIIIATSTTTLINLKKLVPNRIFNKLLKQTLLCASTRIKQVAETYGFIDIINAKSANPEILCKALNQ